MSQVQAVPAALPVESRPLVLASAEAVSIPWTIWLMVAGIGIGIAGFCWDFSWHMTIGRQSFWTGPHAMIHTEDILAGIACTYAILAATFAGAASARDTSVRVLGLYGPAGAFIGLWGSLAMLVSAPFDSWWHSAYGLDVKMITPPHMLLLIGAIAVENGAITWMASTISRSEGALQGRVAWLLLMVGSVLMFQFQVLLSDLTWLNNEHTAQCYVAFAFYPLIMVAVGRGSAQKWGCTILTAFNTGIILGSSYVLQLIPAQPKLGPVYHNSGHLLPLGFPLLMIVPAFVADLVFLGLKQRSSWIQAVAVGPAFVLSFLAVQWPCATFLMFSPAARNPIFMVGQFAYFDPAGILYDPYKFNATEPPGAFVLTMVAALVVSIVTTRLGMVWGDWMRRVRR